MTSHKERRASFLGNTPLSLFHSLEGRALSVALRSACDDLLGELIHGYAEGGDDFARIDDDGMVYIGISEGEDEVPVIYLNTRAVAAVAADGLVQYGRIKVTGLHIKISVGALMAQEPIDIMANEIEVDMLPIPWFLEKAEKRRLMEKMFGAAAAEPEPASPKKGPKKEEAEEVTSGYTMGMKIADGLRLIIDKVRIILRPAVDSDDVVISDGVPEPTEYEDDTCCTSTWSCCMCKLRRCWQKPVPKESPTVASHTSDAQEPPGTMIFVLRDVESLNVNAKFQPVDGMSAFVNQVSKAKAKSGEAEVIVYKKISCSELDMFTSEKEGMKIPVLCPLQLDIQMATRKRASDGSTIRTQVNLVLPHHVSLIGVAEKPPITDINIVSETHADDEVRTFKKWKAQAEEQVKTKLWLQEHQITSWEDIQAAQDQFVNAGFDETHEMKKADVKKYFATLGLNVSDETFDEIFDRIDVDHSHSVSWGELSAYLGHVSKASTSEDSLKLEQKLTGLVEGMNVKVKRRSVPGEFEEAKFLAKMDERNIKVEDGRNATKIVAFHDIQDIMPADPVGDSIDGGSSIRTSQWTCGL